MKQHAPGTLLTVKQHIATLKSDPNRLYAKEHVGLLGDQLSTDAQKGDLLVVLYDPGPIVDFETELTRIIKQRDNPHFRFIMVLVNTGVMFWIVNSAVRVTR